MGVLNAMIERHLELLSLRACNFLSRHESGKYIATITWQYPQLRTRKDRGEHLHRCLTTVTNVRHDVPGKNHSHSLVG